MNLKILTNIKRGDIELKKDEVYEVVDIIQDTYKIKVMKKQKEKFRYVLVKEDEGELIDWVLD